MAADVIMPSLGFDMTEGTVGRWLVGEGDRIEKGQAIAEIETEKATVEIEATASGTLTKIVVPAGRTVPVGTVIGRIAAAGEEAERGAAAAKAEEAAGPSAGPLAAEEAKEKPDGREKAARKDLQAAEPGGAEPKAPSGKRVKASPVARRMAEDAGLDVAGIEGSGPGGRVMERDVQAAIEATAQRKPSSAGAASAASGGPVPLNRMRQAIARRMAESKKAAPHFYVTVEIRMDEALNVREQLNRVAPEAEKVTVTDLVVAAAARSLVRFPDLNASYRDGALETHPQVNVGIATALEEGLITPVLREADRKPLKRIAAESRALGARARGNKLRSEDLGSGTFTVSNLGMYDVDEFTAIINPPEAAILAVGAVTRRPVADGDEVRIAAVMKATLSVDHRAADGAQAGRFLQELKKLLENPVNLLTD